MTRKILIAMGMSLALSGAASAAVPAGTAGLAKDTVAAKAAAQESIILAKGPVRRTFVRRWCPKSLSPMCGS
ncbi:hypothetical protein [Mesorhizobium xinjiangense]|uniref:hypothetical protein n=1 Tax=Mesorhizobium xinjiangense TaxID=2678685 RepID=UPI0012EE0D9A|nr:hypothetical protein [Mesorhizobium xinjiangense]